ncbi:MAG TPA: hypothetical protein VFE02_16815 [Candidatus Acidoferrales bacterium]|jgi:hypothetical protein|nr:hypothetical protein [Candidatus Acidoferrales bacterium]
MCAAYFGALTISGGTLALATAAWAQSGTSSDVSKSQNLSSSLSHDLSGVWMPYPDTDVPPGTGKYAIDPSTRPALTAWGHEKFNASRPLLGPRAIPGEENSPSLKCDPDGPPKLLNHPNPFEIVQMQGRMLMFFEEQHIWRNIWADGRPLPKDPDPSYLGYAVARWEGDTFIIETSGFNDKQWADPFGDPRSDKMHLIERYRRLNHDTLEQQIIIDDPKAYTKIWVSLPKLYKFEPSWEIAEWFCVVDEDKSYDDTVRKPAGAAPGKVK